MPTSSHNTYDDEPVVYCAKCYSLNIKYEESLGLESCDDCGCSDTVESSVEDWEKLYTKRYGHKLVEKTGDVRKSPLYDLPLSKLKNHLYHEENCMGIIKTLYPRFPRGLTKAEAVLLFFDRILKEARLEEFKRYYITLKTEHHGKTK